MIPEIDMVDNCFNWHYVKLFLSVNKINSNIYSLTCKNNGGGVANEK